MIPHFAIHHTLIDLWMPPVPPIVETPLIINPHNARLTRAYLDAFCSHRGVIDDAIRAEVARPWHERGRVWERVCCMAGSVGVLPVECGRTGKVEYPRRNTEPLPQDYESPFAAFHAHLDKLRKSGKAYIVHELSGQILPDFRARVLSGEIQLGDKKVI